MALFPGELVGCFDFTSTENHEETEAFLTENNTAYSSVRTFIGEE